MRLIIHMAEVDQDQLNTDLPPVPKNCDHTTCDGICWKGYPQSRFPNWTPRQVKKCKIQSAIDEYDADKKCVIHKLDVNKLGIFLDAGTSEMTDDKKRMEEQWKQFIEEKVHFFTGRRYSPR
jgi:hypothetical protein